MILNSILGNVPGGRSFRPAGWVKKQLEIQAAGLAGNLDKVWRDVRDSAWIGGTADGWERVPYWLDGFIDLAWLLDDADMQARAKRYVDGILAQQKPDGWLCPCSDEERATYDMWSLFLLGKVLLVWEHRTGDDRIFPALYKAYRQLPDHLRRNPLFRWGRARWFEGLIPIAYLYRKTGEAWLPELVELLREQGMDFQEKLRNWRWTEKEKEWTFEAHVVNCAMELHSELLYQAFHPETEDNGNAFAHDMLGKLLKYHGMANGHFTGDECLSGLSPVQGTELCGVVEAMFSAELLLAATGDSAWGDYLETLAYNALPATCSEDMWTHQYDQQTNQIGCCIEENPVYSTNHPNANIFGLEPNFGCCTANFGQGWPKLSANTFLVKEDGVTAALLLPGVLQTVLAGREITLTQDTCYPFRDHGVLTVEAPEDGAEFTVRIRIPGFARSAEVAGEAVAPGTFWECRKVWKGKTVLAWHLTFETETFTRPNGMQAVRRGPFLYSLPVAARWVMHEYEQDGVERKFPYCDYELFAEEAWNYGFAGNEFQYEEQEMGEVPFSEKNPPCVIYTDMQQIPWQLNENSVGVAAPLPESCKGIAPVERKKLIPYGCTKLRMTEMPRRVAPAGM